MSPDIPLPSQQTILEPMWTDPELAALAADLLWDAARALDVHDWLGRGLGAIGSTLALDGALVARARSGQWAAVTQFGRRVALPLELLADALDGERPAQHGAWGVVPLDAEAGASDMLAAHVAAGALPASTFDKLVAVAPVVAHAMRAIHDRQAQAQRIARLQAMLQIAGGWNQAQDMRSLLVEIAEASTRLLGADRASIFLWDRPAKKLVARPALGVEDDELRIPDDAGVVGRVIQTGRPHRAGRTDQDLIARQVDEQLGYTTHTLLCVPLRSADREILGAFEVVNKLDGDFTDDDETALTELAGHAATALANTKQRETLLRAHRQMTDQAAQEVQLIGESPPIQALRSTIDRVADTDLAILILGENGTGKEVVSRMLHYLSQRRDQPLVAVNCAAISETLLESELFGHEKGAFTDARESRAGKFELAAGGTLFLDEIGDLSPSGQAKLLRVLEEKVVVRVGGSTPIRTDARVIAATNQDLAAMVEAKRFREDLFYRLNVVALELPPLRERGDDVLLLAEHFLEGFCRQARRPVPALAAAARRKLQSHRWPGNVRELRNLMERLAYLSSGDRIEADELDFILTPGGESPALVAPDLPLAEATNTFQCEYIKKAVSRAGDNMSEAAKQLGLHRSNLYRKMRQLGMSTGEP